jgi:hypothetical protein
MKNSQVGVEGEINFQNQERRKLMQVEAKMVHGCIMSERNSKDTPNVELGERPLPLLL